MERVPFSPGELDVIEFYPARFSNALPAPRFNTPITPRENYKMVYSGQLPMWMPLESDKLMMTPRIDPDNMARAFAFEANSITEEEKIGGPDKFGIEWIYVPVAGGSMVKPGNPVLADANDWKETIRFPNIDEWDWEGTKKANEEHCATDRLVQVTILTGFFERLISFMDFENAALAIIDEDQKDAVHELFSSLADLHIAMIDKYIEAYNPDLIQLHDDWGSQRAPFFSLATAREMLVPYVRRVVNHCHLKGLFLDMHSCGKNELLVPAYIEAGCDSWSGQAMNDKEMLYELYGDKIILGIAPSVASSAPPYSNEAVVASAKEFVSKYAGGYAEKPVLSAFMGATPEYYAALYEGGRRAFCGT